MSAKPSFPIGTPVRVIDTHSQSYGKQGRVVRGRPEPRPGYAYVEFRDHLPSTSVLMAVTALEVAR